MMPHFGRRGAVSEGHIRGGGGKAVDGGQLKKGPEPLEPATAERGKRRRRRRGERCKVPKTKPRDTVGTSASGRC